MRRKCPLGCASAVAVAIWFLYTIERNNIGGSDLVAVHWGVPGTRDGSISRASIYAYLASMPGLLYIAEAVHTVLASGPALSAVGRFVLGAFAVGGGLIVYRSPDVHRGAEPAPWYLYVLAGLVTVPAGFWIFSTLL